MSLLRRLWSWIIGTPACPYCGYWKFEKGPGGGMEVNMKCGNCKKKSQYSPVMGMRKVD
jgi:DNA-directed RNA polymerase subunit RPC12/RpoP